MIIFLYNSNNCGSCFIQIQLVAPSSVMLPNSPATGRVIGLTVVEFAPITFDHYSKHFLLRSSEPDELQN